MLVIHHFSLIMYNKTHMATDFVFDVLTYLLAFWKFGFSMLFCHKARLAYNILTLLSLMSICNLFVKSKLDVSCHTTVAIMSTFCFIFHLEQCIPFKRSRWTISKTGRQLHDLVPGRHKEQATAG